MRTFAKIREAEYHARRDARSTEIRTAARTAERITTRPGGPVHRALGTGGPPIVIVNALAQGDGYWWPLITTLAPRHRMLLCQQPTTGGLTDQLADLVALLDAEQARECHLLGWCTGAKLAARLAREQPERVLSLTMLAADFRHTGRDPGLDGPYERNLAAVCRALLDRPALAPQLTTLFTANPEPTPALASSEPGSAAAESDRVLASSEPTSALANPRPGSAAAELGPALANFEPGSATVDAVLARPDPELAQEIRRPFASGAALLAYARQLVEFWSHDELGATTDIPTLFLIGDHDEIVAPAAERAAAATFPTALHAEFALGSHYLMYEQPELVADVITDFLRDPATCPDRAGGLRWR